MTELSVTASTRNPGEVIERAACPNRVGARELSVALPAPRGTLVVRGEMVVAE